MIRRPAANPLHHNYGRAQSDKGRFSARLTWVRFQLLAAHGNIAASKSQFDSEYLKSLHKLTPEAVERFVEIRSEIRTLTARMKTLADEIAELNSPDKWAK